MVLSPAGEDDLLPSRAVQAVRRTVALLSLHQVVVEVGPQTAVTAVAAVVRVFPVNPVADGILMIPIANQSAVAKRRVRKSRFPLYPRLL